MSCDVCQTHPGAGRALYVSYMRNERGACCWCCHRCCMGCCWASTHLWPLPSRQRPKAKAKAEPAIRGQETGTPEYEGGRRPQAGTVGVRSITDFTDQLASCTLGKGPREAGQKVTLGRCGMHHNSVVRCLQFLPIVKAKMCVPSLPRRKAPPIISISEGRLTCVLAEVMVWALQLRMTLLRRVTTPRE